jgi:hypothetical protein
MNQNYSQVSADRIERIIRFFKSLKVKKPVCKNPDDYGRDKTEAEYQQEQARWLAERKQKRRS